LTLTATLGLFASCSEDFLLRTPETEISTGDFFKTADDLKAYVNGFYNDGGLLIRNQYSGWENSALVDFESDNAAFWQHRNYAVLLGVGSPLTIGGWNDWGSLRHVNVMLDNLGNAAAVVPAELNHYAGIARYFRAMFYINKVQGYSDVPWYNKVLTSSDPDIYKTQDSRAAVVDSILADLEFAAFGIKEDIGNRTQVNRFVALAQLSRFCLYEGTYRKYHPELNLASTANRFLERAASAADEIIVSGKFGLATGSVAEVIPGTGIMGCKAFRDIFSSLSLKDNPEILMWLEFGGIIRNRLGNLMSSNTHRQYSLSRSLMESFLLRDGRPFSTVADYDKKEFKDIFANRDPRMAETFAYPGAHMIDPDRYVLHVPDGGGYDQIKYFPESNSEQTADNSGGWTGIPLYRYAEVLLNYAEAKAELGDLKEFDIARSINLLRERVGMEAFDAAREVDADLRAQYPGITDNNILALRRERRVELAGEGFRKQDIHRWSVGALQVATSSLQGIYVPQLPYLYDSDGTGPGGMVGIVKNEAAKNALPQNVQDQATNWHYLDEQELYLENGTYGHVRKNGDKLRSFVSPKYYYTPIPHDQIVLNPNLKQSPYWK
jgi:hypothetical protein